MLFPTAWCVSAVARWTECEWQVAFADLKDDMDLAEDYLKYLVAYALAHCQVLTEFSIGMIGLLLTFRNCCRSLIMRSAEDSHVLLDVVDSYARID